MSARLFVAILLPDYIKQELIKAQKALRHLDLALGSYVRQENLHLTLKFLGHVENLKIPEIIKCLGLVKAAPLELQIGQIGFFPLRTIFASLVSDYLVDLVNKINIELINFSLPERNSYHAHITLLRVKKISHMKHFLDSLEHIKLKPLCFQAQEFVLMESSLTHEGPSYTIRERFVL